MDQRTQVGDLRGRQERRVSAWGARVDSSTRAAEVDNQEADARQCLVMADGGSSVRRVRCHFADAQERMLTCRFGASTSDSGPSEIGHFQSCKRPEQRLANDRYQVQLPSVSGRNNRPILKSGRPRSPVTHRHQMQAGRPQFDQSNWNGRPASDMPVSTVNHALPDLVRCLYRAELFDIHGTPSCRSPSSAPA